MGTREKAYEALRGLAATDLQPGFAKLCFFLGHSAPPSGFPFLEQPDRFLRSFWQAALAQCGVPTRNLRSNRGVSHEAAPQNSGGRARQGPEAPLGSLVLDGVA